MPDLGYLASVFVGHLLWLQQGMQEMPTWGWDGGVGSGGLRYPGVEGAGHEPEWGGVSDLQRQESSWRQSCCEDRRSLGLPSLTPQPWAGGALPLQAAPLTEKSYSQGTWRHFALPESARPAAWHGSSRPGSTSLG